MVVVTPRLYDAIRLEGTDSLSYDLQMDSQSRAGRRGSMPANRSGGEAKLGKQIESEQRAGGFVTV